MSASPATALRSTRARLSSFDAVELLLGRADWRWADYVAAGEREFDALHVATDGPSPFAPADRAIYAIRYAELACPSPKRHAAQAAERTGRFVQRQEAKSSNEHPLARLRGNSASNGK